MTKPNVEQEAVRDWKEELIGKVVRDACQKFVRTGDVAEYVSRKLLPLLEAGEAMRKLYRDDAQAPMFKAWDAAKKAALEGK